MKAQNEPTCHRHRAVSGSRIGRASAGTGPERIEATQEGERPLHGQRGRRCIMVGQARVGEVVPGAGVAVEG